MPNQAPATPWRFSRFKVADQAAVALREAIRIGELGDPLPGEHQLARQLGISRPSVRAALSQLAKEGLVIIKKGHRSRLTSRRKVRTPSIQPAVCFICPGSPESLYFQDHPVLTEMNGEFARSGVRSEVVFEARLGGPHPEARLEQIAATRPHVCWILFGAPAPVQRWFARRTLPTLVVGSCAAGVELPSADTDYGAVGWHAAGVLVKHGHQRIALVLPNKLLPGDAATRAGFMRYIEQRTRDVHVTDWTGPMELARRRASLGRLLTGADRPTALLSARPALTFAILLHAPGVGLRIPGDLSILSRDTHPFFDWTVPELSRYSSTASKVARSAVRIASRLLAGQNVPARPSLITPTFVPGSTLGKWVAGKWQA